jgi:hypothetical protein
VARADVEAFIKRHREANRAGGGARRHRMPPGPRPARNWQEHVLGEIVRAFTAGRRRPSGPELAQSCQDRLGHAPDVSAINGLIRDVLRGG